MRFLFRPSWGFILAYVVLCLMFGSLTFASSLFKDDAAVRVVASIVIATALLHYYLDGFIWKIRDHETREALGVQNRAASCDTGSVQGVPSRRFPAWVGHAALWLLFVVPGVLLCLMQVTSPPSRPLQVSEKLVRTFPDSAQAHNELGKQLQEAGRFLEAAEQFERATVLAPSMLAPHVFLGALLGRQNDIAGAKTQLEQALRIDPNNAQAHNNLGIVFDKEERLPQAKAEYERALDLDPGYALAHNNLGIVLCKMGDFGEAKLHFQQALHLNPGFVDAQQNLASTEAALRGH